MAQQKGNVIILTSGLSGSSVLTGFNEHEKPA
jgi:hypothetical protein